MLLPSWRSARRGINHPSTRETFNYYHQDRMWCIQNEKRFYWFYSVGLCAEVQCAKINVDSVKLLRPEGSNTG